MQGTGPNLSGSVKLDLDLLKPSLARVRLNSDIGTPDIVSDIGISILGYLILYPISYPILEFPYPNIGKPDIIPDVVPDIGVTVP